MSLPLEGIRVLDLSRLLPGGFCSLLLADFGADVLKVEDTGMGDYVRWSPPYVDGAQESARSALFLSLNRNKRSVRLDLKSDGGREALLRLVPDVLLTQAESTRAHLAAIAELLTQVRCYTVRSGHDLERAAQLVRALVREDHTAQKP